MWIDTNPKIDTPSVLKDQKPFDVVKVFFDKQCFLN